VNNLFDKGEKARYKSLTLSLLYLADFHAIFFAINILACHSSASFISSFLSA